MGNCGATVKCSTEFPSRGTTDVDVFNLNCNQAFPVVNDNFTMQNKSHFTRMNKSHVPNSVDFNFNFIYINLGVLFAFSMNCRE